MITQLPQPKEIESHRRWLRPREWRQVTGMSHGLTYSLLRSGQIHAFRVGERWFIDVREVESFFERHGRPAA